ncbi:MAG: type II toxin-antitoxin system RelE/ParE family toxin [Sulfuritalea sp.]|nr:type II toxin-antitoxin system RelE/ParE family toxin [Sulfuritalea sp.]
MKIRYLSVAEIEFDEAVAWYLARSRGAARHFSKEVRIVERLLLKHPRIGRCVELDARSLCVNDFPYNLIYSIEKTEITVVAVAHHSRRPGYWMDRLHVFR